jgi:hypothetical protein
MDNVVHATKEDWGTYLSTGLGDAAVFQQTLEDMDLIFGDTAAHEEKKRIKHIEAELRGNTLFSTGNILFAL